MNRTGMCFAQPKVPNGSYVLIITYTNKQITFFINLPLIKFYHSLDETANGSFSNEHSEQISPRKRCSVAERQ